MLHKLEQEGYSGITTPPHLSCYSPLKTKPAALNLPNLRGMGLKIRETFRFC